MTKDVTTTAGTSLEVPDSLANSGAWKVAKYIVTAESDVRLAKGKFYNACERGTREDICNYFGWKYSAMAEYAMFANESLAIAKKTTFTHWKNAKRAGVKKADRPAILREAIDKCWTPKQLTAEINKAKAPKKPTRIIEVTPEQLADTQERIKKGGEVEAVKVGMTQATAKEILGISPLTAETLAIIYKALAKKAHPDAGGTVESMQAISEANTVLKEIV